MWLERIFILKAVFLFSNTRDYTVNEIFNVVNYSLFIAGSAAAGWLQIKERAWYYLRRDTYALQEQKTGPAVQGGIDMDIRDLMRDMMRRDQQEKLERYRVLNRNVKKGQILFTGSSLMEQFPINELLMTNGMNVIIYNRGIGGFTTVDMLDHMEEMVFGTEPSKIFINIGTNDIGSPDYRQEDLLRRYEKIISLIKGRLPEAQIFMMAYYPVNETDKVSDEEWGKTAFATRTNENIAIANEAVERLAAKTGCHFINVNQGLTDERGKLKKEFTVEGIHMYANGYQVVLHNLKKYL